jgi:hypothetical protein
MGDGAGSGRFEVGGLRLGEVAGLASLIHINSPVFFFVYVLCFRFHIHIHIYISKIYQA